MRTFQRLVYEHGIIIGIDALERKRQLSAKFCQHGAEEVCSRTSNGAHSVEPVAISVSTSVWIKLPRAEGPLWRPDRLRQSPAPDPSSRRTAHVPALLHRLDQERQQRFQSLAANPVRCLPENYQRISFGFLVNPATRAANRGLPISPRSRRIACFRWKPVTTTNSSRIRALSARLASL